MPQETDIEKMRKDVEELVYSLMKTHGSIDIQNVTPKIIGMSSYLSSYDVQQLIKWNRILAFSTVILAIATVFLAIITYFKS